MDHRHRGERVRAALAGNPVDRTQTGEVWQHSHGPVIGEIDHIDTWHQGTPAALAALSRGAGEHTREEILTWPPMLGLSSVPSRKPAGGPRRD